MRHAVGIQGARAWGLGRRGIVDRAIRKSYDTLILHGSGEDRSSGNTPPSTSKAPKP